MVVGDYLEHVHDDATFARELDRILKPGGQVIINVPHLRPRSWLTRLRHAIGLSDELHGHVRPEYDLQGLRELLGRGLVIDRAITYSRTFSELIDTGLNGLYLKAQEQQGPRRGRERW